MINRKKMASRISSLLLYSIALLISISAISVLVIVPLFVSTEATTIGNPNLSDKNPFGNGMPEIVMDLGGESYYGELRYFVWERGEANHNFPANEPPRSNITTILPNKTATLEKGSQVMFSVKDNPVPEAQPDSLSVTAYTTDDGAPIKVLSVSNNKTDTFDIDLDKGKYILLATATWFPDEGNYLATGGYVSYAFRINVTNM